MPDRGITRRLAAAAPLAGLMSFGANGGRAAARALSEPRRRSLDAALEAQVAGGATPGAILVVSEWGDVVYEGARGVWERGSTEPLRPDTVFWTASLTKPVVAVATLMLLAERKLRLDDPVSRFIPAFARAGQVRVLKPGSPPIPTGPNAASAPQPEYDLVPASRPITIKDILTHTSGLQTIGVPNPAVPPVEDGDTLATWVPKLAAVPLDFQPGARWAYSNAVAFNVAARIVEIASGQTFDRFLKARVFDPLRMRDTGFGLYDRAEYAGRSMTPTAQQLADPQIKGKTFFSGSAGLWTTARDYAHLAEMLVNGGEWRGRRLLGADAVRMMTATEQANGLYPGLDRQARRPGFGFGLGVQLITDPAAAGVATPAGSFGWDGAGGKRFWASPRQRRVVMMYATSRPAQAAIEQAVLEALA